MLADNIHFMMYLVENIRTSINEGRFVEYRDEFMKRYYANGGRAKAD